jgi:hypothetical protein
MLEVREARGRWVRRPQPPRRLWRLLLLLLVLTCGAVSAPALGASGGAGIGAHSSPPRHAGSESKAVTGGGNPLSGRAMWIWELPSVDGGNLSAIIAGAHRYGIGTLLIKSSDGTDLWSQFNSQLVSTLHANGLRVCAWQYVYGNHPVTEAYNGAAAVHDGADCLVIDAESEYEGKYVSAQTYVTRLRSLIGAGYPVALAGFPYVDFHPAFPYSVFLGPDGAQYNVPQMYWKDIGVTTDTVFAHTFAYNLVYGRPIFPLGQVYNRPATRQVVRFRELARVYGAGGLSWWDWQDRAAGQGRHGRMGPGASDLGRPSDRRQRRFRLPHAARGAGLPGSPRPLRRRGHRAADLGRAPALRAGQDQVGLRPTRRPGHHRPRRALGDVTRPRSDRADGHPAPIVLSAGQARRDPGRRRRRPTASPVSATGRARQAGASPATAMPARSSNDAHRSHTSRRASAESSEAPIA